MKKPEGFKEGNDAKLRERFPFFGVEEIDQILAGATRCQTN